MAQDKSNVLPFPKKGIAQSPGSASIIDRSASSGTRNLSLQEPELRVAVSRIVLYGTYRETKHSARDRSYRNVTDDDIQTMLNGEWVLAEPPAWDEGHANWKYKLAGHDIDGDELFLLVSVDQEQQMITIITKF